MNILIIWYIDLCLMWLHSLLIRCRFVNNVCIHLYFCLHRKLSTSIVMVHVYKVGFNIKVWGSLLLMNRLKVCILNTLRKTAPLMLTSTLLIVLCMLVLRRSSLSVLTIYLSSLHYLFHCMFNQNILYNQETMYGYCILDNLCITLTTRLISTLATEFCIVSYSRAIEL